jgi:UDP-N-acetylglucosamine/UDP-N-acetylgalactosamine diphosphorylase
MPDKAAIAHRLEAIGQSHLLRFFDELPASARDHLLRQIESIDLESLPRYIDAYVRNKPAAAAAGELAPAPYYPNNPESRVRPWDRRKYRDVGEDLLRGGRVAAFTVAGGQGTRLGFDGPKGLYPAGAVSNKPLFQVFAEGLLAAGRKYGRPVPWYIMTSPLNHAATVEFFERQRFLGLDKRNVVFFPQGVMPSFEMGTGRMLLAEKGEVATNPDGHGGAVRALHLSGAIADMQKRGVEQISYFQVDNPLVRVVDPVFLGLHAAAPDSSGEMSSKMVPKAGPEEKVGVFCTVNGRIEVVEYSDLPESLAKATSPDGTLKFVAGSIAVHILSVEFVQRLATSPKFELPFHRAEKKVPFVDLESGGRVEPEKPNAVKLEKFIFDALPLCRRSLVYETERVEEFAPIKNAAGVDSAESSRELQTERAARWLEAAGVRVPRRADGKPECVLEVSALAALDPEDLRARSIPAIERGSRLVL